MNNNSIVVVEMMMEHYLCLNLVKIYFVAKLNIFVISWVIKRKAGRKIKTTWKH